MKKAVLMEYGIPEEKIREFNEAYWKDVHKHAERLVEEGKGQDAASSAPAVREAITAMLRLIPDPERLYLILAHVNRQYQQYNNERNGHGSNARKPPETAQEGA